MNKPTELEKKGFKKEEICPLCEGSGFVPKEYVEDYWKTIENEKKSFSAGVESGEDKIVKRVKERIGSMRQWLNEDRITDPKKLVENEQLMHWLNPLKDNSADLHKSDERSEE